MIVEVKVGDKIISRGGEREEIRIDKMRALLKNSSKVPSNVLQMMLKDDLHLAEQLKETLNPEYVDEDRLLDWRLSAVTDLAVKPNISKNFLNDFFQTGYVPGELYVLSGISGGGKTSFAVHIATVLASGINRFSDLDNGERATIFYLSLEQSKRQIEARVMANLSATLFGKKDLTFSEILFGMQSFSHEFEEALWAYMMIEERLHVYDSSCFEGFPTVQEVVALLRNDLEKMTDTEKKLIIIDRLENIVGGTANLDDSVVLELKKFAIQQNVPVLLQCQMSKSAIESARTSDGGFNMEKLSGSSLKGTSGLEHNCSNIMILVPDERKKDTLQKSEKLITIVQPKTRYGSNEKIKLNFYGSCGLFTEYVETRGRKKKENTELDDEGE